MAALLTPGFHVSTAVGERATGVYIAYPTTELLKPTYRGHKTLVNFEHTKVGITTSGFYGRWSEYNRTFGGEVAFHRLIELSGADLLAFEQRLLAEMRARYPRSGSAREWFRTTERDAIAALVQSLYRATFGSLPSNLSIDADPQQQAAASPQSVVVRSSSR